jgi:uncharacterized lipoprotein YajG
MKSLICCAALACASLAVTGCAFTRADLNVNYPESAAKQGPLSSIAPLSVQVDTFSDARPDRDRIGYKRNGFGMQTADIVTTQPVPLIIRDAIAVELKKNGHLTQADHAAAITGVIRTFWFDIQVNFWTIEFMGTIGLDLAVVDSATKNVLITRTYQAHYDEKSMAGYTGTWERVMNVTLERLVRQIGTDQKLIDALKSINTHAQEGGKTVAPSDKPPESSPGP